MLIKMKMEARWARSPKKRKMFIVATDQMRRVKRMERKERLGLANGSLSKSVCYKGFSTRENMSYGTRAKSNGLFDFLAE